MDRQFSCRTASIEYSMSEAYFRKLIQAKAVAFHRFGRSVRFDKMVLDAHFESKRVK